MRRWRVWPSPLRRCLSHLRQPVREQPVWPATPCSCPACHGQPVRARRSWSSPLRLRRGQGQPVRAQRNWPSPPLAWPARSRQPGRRRPTRAAARSRRVATRWAGAATRPRGTAGRVEMPGGDRGRGRHFGGAQDRVRQCGLLPGRRGAVCNRRGARRQRRWRVRRGVGRSGGAGPGRIGNDARHLHRQVRLGRPGRGRRRDHRRRRPGGRQRQGRRRDRRRGDGLGRPRHWSRERALRQPRHGCARKSGGGLWRDDRGRPAGAAGRRGSCGGTGRRGKPRTVTGPRSLGRAVSTVGSGGADEPSRVGGGGPLTAEFPGRALRDETGTCVVGEPGSAGGRSAESGGLTPAIWPRDRTGGKFGRSGCGAPTGSGVAPVLGTRPAPGSGGGGGTSAPSATDSVGTLTTGAAGRSAGSDAGRDGSSRAPGPARTGAASGTAATRVAGATGTGGAAGSTSGASAKPVSGGESSSGAAGSGWSPGPGCGAA